MQRAFHKVSIPVGTCQDMFRQKSGKDETSVVIPWITWGGTGVSMLMPRAWIPQFPNLEQAWDLIRVIAFWLGAYNQAITCSEGNLPSSDTSSFGPGIVMRGNLPGAWYRIPWQEIGTRQLSDCHLQKMRHLPQIRAQRPYALTDIGLHPFLGCMASIYSSSSILFRERCYDWSRKRRRGRAGRLDRARQPYYQSNWHVFILFPGWRSL